jgi:hypothetical protein
MIASLLLLLALTSLSSAFTTPLQSTALKASLPAPRILYSSWDNFGYDDEDELLEVGPDEGFVAADENDDPEVKAAAGMSLEPPEVFYDGPVIQVPVGEGVALQLLLFVELWKSN